MYDIIEHSGGAGSSAAQTPKLAAYLLIPQQRNREANVTINNTASVQ